MLDPRSHLRFALRQLRRNPGFSLTAILTLAVGIGATTAIFSLFYAVLLRPLSFPEANRLASVNVLSFPASSKTNTGGVPDDVSYPDFFDWRNQNHSFESLASYHGLNATLESNGTARMVPGIAVSADFFHVFGVSPNLGRAFTRDEEKAGNRSVVLSHELWLSDFNASPTVIGQTLKIFDDPYTVVGVMPASFSYPIQAQAPNFWITSARDSEGADPSSGQRGWQQLNIIGRLKPGVSLAQAQAEMNSVQEGISKRFPDSDLNNRATRVVPVMETVAGDIRPALHVLFGAVAALLLISCANVAGLLLARGSGRQAELSVRAALGASRREIMLQLLSESVLLSLIGGAAGTAFAVVMLQGLLHLIPAGVPRVAEASINGTVLAFTFGVSLVTGILFGMLPARRLSRLDPALALRDGTRTSTAGRKQNRVHSLLVVVETALSLILLVGAGLLIRSFLHVLAADPGFSPQHVLTFRAGFSPKRYKDDTASLAIYRQVLFKVEALPGVRQATAVFPLPLSGSGITLTFSIEGRAHATGDEPSARASVIEPSYFQTLQIPLLQGRTFSPDEDEPKGRPVVIVNQAFARKYFPGEDPIGKRIEPGLRDDDNKKHMREIIAVAADVKRSGMAEEATPEYYLPYGPANITSPYFAVRVAGDPASYMNSVRAAVASLDKDAPVYQFKSLEELITAANAQSRFQTMLLTAFAAIALLLAAIGLYAVLSYMVVQRTHEIGLRMALGAPRGKVLTMILSRGIALALIGVVIGIAASSLLTRFLATMLYGVKPLDPITFGCVALVLLLVSAIASFAPATRAASLDPMKTLRDQ